VVGRFENGTGIFTGEDTLDGKPILVRYTWSDTHTAALGTGDVGDQGKTGNQLDYANEPRGLSCRTLSHLKFTARRDQINFQSSARSYCISIGEICAYCAAPISVRK
jgi:hypothetical protein